MAGDPSLQLSWHLSGGTGNTNPDLSLGGVRANARIRHLQEQVSANGSAGDVRVYFASVNANWINSIAYFRDGNAGGWASRVRAISTGSGWIDLVDPLPTSISIGDWVFGYNKAYGVMPFGPTTALESAQGFTQYIGLYCTNGGASLTDFRWWIEEENPGNVLHEIAPSDDTGHTLTTIPNKETEPDLSGMLSGGGASRWTSARTFLSGWPIFNFSAGVVGFWLKRTVPPDSLRNTSQWTTLVGETPGGFVSKCCLHWDTVGFTPLLELNHAPTVYLRGGARFKAYVRAQETGLRVVGAPVSWQKTAGPGTLTPPPEPSETDDDGVSLARYEAPVDVGEIGNTVTIEAGI